MQNVTKIAVDGRSVRVLYKKVERRRSQVPTLLIINGIGATIDTLKPFTDVYSNSDVLALDFPTEYSYGALVKPFKIRQYVEYLCKVLDKLEIKTVAVMGYSWGGAVAQELTKLYPNKVSHLILVATGLGGTTLPSMNAVLYSWKNPFNWYNPSALESYVFGTSLPKVGLRTNRPQFFYQLTAIACWSSLIWLRKLNTKALVLHAQDDELVSPLNAKLLSTLLPNVNCKIYENGGHLVLLNQAQKVIIDVSEFINSPCLTSEKEEEND